MPKGRENATDQVVIGFSFASDWLREVSRGFRTNHRVKLTKNKAIPEYFRHSIVKSLYRSLRHSGRNLSPYHQHLGQRGKQKVRFPMSGEKAFSGSQ